MCLLQTMNQFDITRATKHMHEAVYGVWLLQRRSPIFTHPPHHMHLHGQSMKKRKNPLTVDDLLNKRLRPEEFATANATFTDTLGSMYSWAPTIQTLANTFQGQTAEVYTCEFSPSGQHIASAGAERSIYLWDTFSDGDNYGIIRAHLGAILELHWSKDGSKVFTASADKTCGVFDAQTGERLKSCKGHMSVVNSCSQSRQGPELLVSGSDDGSVKIWDLRAKNSIDSFDFQCPVTSVCFSDSSDLVFVGGANRNGIVAWDVRMKRVQFSLSGHTDTITGIRLSPDGTRLLSNALDNTLQIWDVKPSFVDNRRQMIIEGAPHGLETHLVRPAWSRDGLMAGAGAGDGAVVIWNTFTGELVHKYTAHHAGVNEVDFHPTESIVISCSSDRTLFLEAIK